MTELIVIVAVSQNRVIGKDNDIPWRISEDFKHFKETTKGYPCIMGDKTYESLPIKPLPGRENIVLTFDKEYKPKGVTVLHSFDDAIEYVNKKAFEKAFITGGASIYKIGMEKADTFILTRVHKDYEGDVYFPEINFDNWELEKREDKEGIDKNTGENVKFSFLTYRRKR